jgi:hypothetical protein
MALKQRAGVAEHLQNVVLIHVPDKLRGRPGKAKRKDSGHLSRKHAVELQVFASSFLVRTSS